MKHSMENIDLFIQEQLQTWVEARNNYESLQCIRTKQLKIGNVNYKVQFNPKRIISSAAKIDKESINERRCFLCASNRSQGQKGLSFGQHYEILVNPFPIFQKHLTIPDIQHTPQCIKYRFKNMLELSDYLKDFVVFYNGPKCGASAPDHAHFQAGNKGFLPIEKHWRENKSMLIRKNNTILWQVNLTPSPILSIESDDESIAESLFTIFYESLESPFGEEPMMNIITWKENDKWIILLFPREKHRPQCYYEKEEDKILISPASVDMGGVFITPLVKDFEKITAGDIKRILSEVCLSSDKIFILEKNILIKWKNLLLM